MTAPLQGITVVDFSQFLAGPYASLKLLDMGARVIKVENPDKGDLCRHLYLSQTVVGSDSTLFHAINRGKESISLDLKSSTGLDAAKRLILRADVVIQNFRPGVIERLGLGYDAVRELKPDIVYGSISGYGETGEWANLPGQDLLAQARSGIMWLTGNADQGPVPIGLPIADITAGAALVQGVLGALFRHARTGQGAKVQTSLLEALLDLQFEFLTTYLNNGESPPVRAEKGSAHGYLAAPYGVYETQSGHLALAMTPLAKLAGLLDAPELTVAANEVNGEFTQRAAIFSHLQHIFLKRSATSWEEYLGSHGVWCAKVLNWNEVIKGSTPPVSDMLAHVREAKGSLTMINAPYCIDGNRRQIDRIGPTLDQHGQAIRREIGLI
ncbi:CaiB/BaiF CoA transferase family protein [Falsihalocynthiibacter sp. SS001]|uniref:CaiB/BaiF CoA transferase family protein n=1 Tax=Falsihalocynthiibacter sp. SS001 TaxID=3349698 RepID=UPI0036D21CC2